MSRLPGVSGTRPYCSKLYGSETYETITQRPAVAGGEQASEWMDSYWRLAARALRESGRTFGAPRHARSTVSATCLSWMLQAVMVRAASCHISVVSGSLRR